MNKPLRILAVVNLPWDPRLGAARVWIELTEEWRRAGHNVEVFCLTNAYPRPTSSGVLSKLRQALFPRRAAAYVRRNAARFDVIDCLIGTLPFSKKSLRFRGLFIARSVGLFRLYENFLRDARKRWAQEAPQGRFLGRIFHRLMDLHFQRSAEASLRVCDLLNVPNDGERAALATDPSLRKPILVQPYGLSDSFRAAFAKAAAPAADRLRDQKICFIGMWSERKGSRDWPVLLQKIWERHPRAQFLFLGTMIDESFVRPELGLNGSGDAKRVICLTNYDAADLPQLLSGAALALFPSYVEGFGLAVLEQLAAGLPTIAYDVPGPRDILEPLRARLLTPAGDPAAMAARASEILELPLPEYEALAATCAAIPQNYRWSEIAAATIAHYREELSSLGKSG